MRRAILAVLAGGLLLSSTACSDDPKSSGVAAPAAATPSASAEPVVSASATPDYTAANKVVCDRLDKTFDTEFGDFGGALGKLMAVQEEKDTANADKAKKQAATELKAIGTQIRKETADAVDPELKAVAATSAQRIEDSAKDLEFIETIKSMKDLDSSLKDQITEWISPLAGYCGVNRAAPESSSATPAESPSTAPSAQ
ncbi:hypothetical protein QLQ12_35015 [Actinoplanes sp. NEAU-A12]|uniref:Uncharacterized protein n=1 Tax=Actinoplanes sandaracinus TaxID=3045177 RepID=A0ABT6WVR4_9ACTN|nr:hypothetical protein [Actinoplanes sandaracinus]MDI6103839.1 hypothetical protein [Actinoplanes sandaracinus]